MTGVEATPSIVRWKFPIPITDAIRRYLEAIEVLTKDGDFLSIPTLQN